MKSSILLAALLLSAGTTATQPELPSRKTLTLEVAHRVAAAAQAEAVRNKWRVAVAVLDDGGHLMVFHRMDGAKLVATDFAVRKARTAVYFQGPTKGLEEEVTTGGRTALLPIEGFMPLEGGVPLIVDGVIVGAIGVSGVTGAQDAQCAHAGAVALRN